MESLNTKRLLAATPNTLPFYVRSATQEKQPEQQPQPRKPSRLVRVPIERTLDAKRVVKRILQSCDLSTEYVDGIKDAPKVKQAESRSRNSYGPKMDYQEAPPPGVFDEDVLYRDVKRAQEERNLSGWLKEHLDVAEERKEALKGLREEIQRMRKELIERLKLEDLRYECGWNIEHFRGCMKSLEYIANLHGHEMRQLERRILVFAPFTGISLDGHVMLFTGDVKHNWIDVS